MLNACDQRFDVTGNLENFCELNKGEAKEWLVNSAPIEKGTNNRIEVNLGRRGHGGNKTHGWGWTPVVPGEENTNTEFGYCLLDVV
jgi:hypothetical protein